MYFFSVMLFNARMKTIDEIRRENLLIAIARAGSASALAKKADISSAYISQIKTRQKQSSTGTERTMGDAVARKIEEAIGEIQGWMDTDHAGPLPRSYTPVIEHDPDDPDFVEIKKVKLKLSAGITGFVSIPDYDDGRPITFRREWLTKKGYSAEHLIAVSVKGESMEPTMSDGDTVVINTLDTTPRDGETYAINYDGEDIIKRMVRDYGRWFLVSDNPDQKRYHRQECSQGTCVVIGRVVLLQRERF